MDGETLIYGTTELRAVLFSLLDLQELGVLELTEWQTAFCKLRVTQAHYSELEKLAIHRIILKYHRNGQITKAIHRKHNANSPENHKRILGKCRRQCGAKKNHIYLMNCPLCKGGTIYFKFSNTDKLSALCTNSNCVRVLDEMESMIKRVPRFANIIPHDRGTFLVESETTGGVFYIVDVVDQTCTCDDFKFRRAELNFEHRCKHLNETNFAVFHARAF